MIYNLTDDVFTSSGALAGRNPVKLRQYDNRLWAVCDDGSIVFSDNGDATTWDELNIILLPNREPCIDFLPVQGGAILLSRTSVYAMYGSGTYQDTSILLIQDRLLLSDSAVTVDNVVYVLGNRGVHRVSLNGIQEIPHDQTEFFKSRYPAWNALSQAVQGVYLYRFHSILYLFQAGYGAQGFLYSLREGGFFKIDRVLPSALPYLVEVFDQNTDFLLGSGDGSIISRSTYPAGVLADFRLSTIQTRHEDADSTREKIWRHLGLVVAVPTHNVLLQVYLDGSDTPTIIKNGCVDLAAGDNIIELFDAEDNFLRSKTISFEISIGGNTYLVDDETGEVLTSGTDNLISDDLPGTPANFALKEIRVKFCEVGAAN